MEKYCIKNCTTKQNTRANVCQRQAEGGCAREDTQALCAYIRVYIYIFTCVQMVRTWPVCALYTEELHPHARTHGTIKKHIILYTTMCVHRQMYIGDTLCSTSLRVWAGHMATKSGLTYIYQQHSILIRFKQFTLYIMMILEPELTLANNMLMYTDSNNYSDQ
jgi:hypothetical protein